MILEFMLPLLYVEKYLICVVRFSFLYGGAPNAQVYIRMGVNIRAGGFKIFFGIVLIDFITFFTFFISLNIISITRVVAVLFKKASEVYYTSDVLSEHH